MIVVTGGGNGIGRALARAAARTGARVVVCDVDNAAMDETKGGDKSIACELLDVSDREAVMSDVRQDRARLWPHRWPRLRRRHPAAPSRCTKHRRRNGGE